MVNKSGAALAAVLLALSSSAAFAADTTPSHGALAPGGASGIQAAQSWMSDNTTAIVLGVAAVAVGVAIIASGHHHNHHSTPDSGGPTGT